MHEGLKGVMFYLPQPNRYFLECFLHYCEIYINTVFEDSIYFFICLNYFQFNFYTKPTNILIISKLLLFVGSNLGYFLKNNKRRRIIQRPLYRFRICFYSAFFKRPLDQTHETGCPFSFLFGWTVPSGHITLTYSSS